MRKAKIDAGVKSREKAGRVKLPSFPNKNSNCPPRAHFNKYQTLVQDNSTIIAPSPLLKHKNDFTDISPMQQCALTPRFPGKRGRRAGGVMFGEDLERAQPSPNTHTPTKTWPGSAHRGHGPTYGHDADWLRQRSICTRDMTCLQ